MVRQNAPADPYRIWEIKTLKKPGEAEVRKELARAAAQVEPIMRRRKWRVPLLQEFEPKNPGLLGLNVNGGGGKTTVIKVRVRRGGGGSFLPYEHTLGTLLHELVHNEIGAHSAKFYAMLDEITKECEELMAKGITGPGQGFDGVSAGRVGGGERHNPPGTQLKDAVRKAAEERTKRQGGMQAGGRRLGGNSLASRGLTAVQAAAMAAERRARDNLWCSSCEGGCREEEEEEAGAAGPSGSSSSGGGIGGGGGGGTGGAPPPAARPSAAERGKGPMMPTGVEGALPRGHRRTQGNAPGSVHGHSDVNGNGGGVIDLIDLTGEASAAPSGMAPPPLVQRDDDVVDLTASDYPAAPSTSSAPPQHRGAPKRPRHGSEGPRALQQHRRQQWACERCTLVNSEKEKRCGACDTPAPDDTDADAADRAPGTLGNGSWGCSGCSLLDNPEDAANCPGCGRWRFSKGPPVCLPPLPGMSGIT